MTDTPEKIWVSTKETIKGSLTGHDWPCVFDHKRDGAEAYRLKSTVDADIAKAEAKIIELWDADIADHNKTIRELTEAARAFQELNCCFRLGKQPSEALFNRLKKAKQALSTRITEAQEDKT